MLKVWLGLGTKTPGQCGEKIVFCTKIPGFVTTKKKKIIKTLRTCLKKWQYVLTTNKWSKKYNMSAEMKDCRGIK